MSTESTDNVTGRVVKTWDKLFVCWNTDSVTGWCDCASLGQAVMSAEILTTLQMPGTNTSFYVCWNTDNVTDAWDKYKFLRLLKYWQHYRCLGQVFSLLKYWQRYRCLGQVFIPAEILTALQMPRRTSFYAYWNTDNVTDAWDKYKFLCLLKYWQRYRCLGQVFMPEILTDNVTDVRDRYKFLCLLKYWQSYRCLGHTQDSFYVCWNTDTVTGNRLCKSQAKSDVFNEALSDKAILVGAETSGTNCYLIM